MKKKYQVYTIKNGERNWSKPFCLSHFGKTAFYVPSPGLTGYGSICHPVEGGASIDFYAREAQYPGLDKK